MISDNLRPVSPPTANENRDRAASDAAMAAFEVALDERTPGLDPLGRYLIISAVLEYGCAKAIEATRAMGDEWRASIERLWSAGQ